MKGGGGVLNCTTYKQVNCYGIRQHRYMTDQTSALLLLIKHLPYCYTKRCSAAFIAHLISVISNFQTSCTCPAIFKLHKFTQWSICHLMSHVTHLHQQCTHTMSPAAAAAVGP